MKLFILITVNFIMSIQLNADSSYLRKVFKKPLLFSFSGGSGYPTGSFTKEINDKSLPLTLASNINWSNTADMMYVNYGILSRDSKFSSQNYNFSVKYLQSKYFHYGISEVFLNIYASSVYPSVTNLWISPLLTRYNNSSEYSSLLLIYRKSRHYRESFSFLDLGLHWQFDKMFTYFTMGLNTWNFEQLSYHLETGVSFQIYGNFNVFTNVYHLKDSINSPYYRDQKEDLSDSGIRVGLSYRLPGIEEDSGN